MTQTLSKSDELISDLSVHLQNKNDQIRKCEELLSEEKAARIACQVKLDAIQLQINEIMHKYGTQRIGVIDYLRSAIGVIDEKQYYFPWLIAFSFIVRGAFMK